MHESVTDCCKCQVYSFEPGYLQYESICGTKGCPGAEIQLAEYTINQQQDGILRGIYEKKPDLLCFSCYIWNISFVRELIRDVKKILPKTRIWVGGPEVSYDAEDFLKEMSPGKPE